jgi:hypothetical protein
MSFFDNIPAAGILFPGAKNKVGTLLFTLILSLAGPAHSHKSSFKVKIAQVIFSCVTHQVTWSSSAKLSLVCKYPFL